MSTPVTTAVNPPDDPFRDDAQVTDTEALSLAAELFGESGRLPAEWFGDASDVADTEAPKSLSPETTTALPVLASGGSLADLMKELALLAARRESPWSRPTEGDSTLQAARRPPALPASNISCFRWGRSRSPSHVIRAGSDGGAGIRDASVSRGMGRGGDSLARRNPEPRRLGRVRSVVGESTFAPEFAFVRAEPRSAARVVVVRDAEDGIRTGLIVPRVVGLRAFDVTRIRPPLRHARFR